VTVRASASPFDRREPRRYREISMMRVRRRLGSIAAVWLMCQLGTLALVPAQLWAGRTDTAASDCACKHGTDATCPMHRTTSTHPRVCLMQGLTTHDSILLNSVLGFFGIVPTAAHVCVPHASGTSTLMALATATSRPAPPEPPPPRA
jgi:hypothetical protein